MIFTGQSELSIDPKQRLAIPAKYRNQWDPARDGAAWVCVPWDRSLRLYTENLFNKLADQFGSTLAPGGNMLEFERHFFGNAERLELDTAGRLTLPKRHLEYTRLGADVVMVGCRDRLEVHDQRDWGMFAAGKFAGLGGLVENMIKLGEMPAARPAGFDAQSGGGGTDQ